MESVRNGIIKNVNETLDGTFCKRLIDTVHYLTITNKLHDDRIAFSQAPGYYSTLQKITFYKSYYHDSRNTKNAIKKSIQLKKPENPIQEINIKWKKY